MTTLSRTRQISAQLTGILFTSLPILRQLIPSSRLNLPLPANPSGPSRHFTIRPSLLSRFSGRRCLTNEFVAWSIFRLSYTSYRQLSHRAATASTLRILSELENDFSQQRESITERRIIRHSFFDTPDTGEAIRAAGDQLLPLQEPNDPVFIIPPRTLPQRRFGVGQPSATPESKMYSYYQILSTSGADINATLILLHFDNCRYLLGEIGEGTQRLLVEHSMKLLNIKEVFLTGTTTWSNTGGLLGLLMSLAAANTHSTEQAARNNEDPASRGQNRLGVHGATNITHTIASARHFVFRRGLPVDMHEYSGQAENLDEPAFSDKNIKVWAIPISPSGHASTSGSPSHSRKRSFDDFQEKETAGSELGLGVDATASEICNAVVKEMFDSRWRFDALFETKLADVELPASIFIRDPVTKSIQRYEGKCPGDPGFEDLDPLTVLVRKPWPAAEVKQLPKTSPSPEAVSYIIKDHDQRGVFNAKKASKLKVPRGPLFSQLVAGKTVTASDGRLVTPDMVLGAKRPSKGVAVLDIPSADYLDNLVERPEWKHETVIQGVQAFIWILGRSVVSDPRWTNFVRSMDQVEHVVVSPESSREHMCFHDNFRALVERHLVDPDRYPKPVFGSSLQKPAVDVFGAFEDKRNPRIASPGDVIQCRPRFEVRTGEHHAGPSIEQIKQGIPEEIFHLSQAARTQAASSADDDLPGQDVEIVTLGTGSSIPSKYRNVSATLVRVPDHGSYLLDCGENTLGQLQRAFTPTEYKEVLRSLKLIWISHLHADHHLGTTSVIKAWHDEMYPNKSRKVAQSPKINTHYPDDIRNVLYDLEDPNPRLVVASGERFISWMKEYSQVEDFGHDNVIPLVVSDHFRVQPEPVAGQKPLAVENQLYLNDAPLDVDSAAWSPLVAAFRARTSLLSIQACPVIHCKGAKGVSLTFPNNFKITYSGDSRPCDRLAYIGKDSTVLVHEATFDDGLVGDARAKYHSSVSEAVGVAMKMQAKRVILTHFSQRYRNSPDLEKIEPKKFAQESAHEQMVSVADQDAENGDVPIDEPIGNIGPASVDPPPNEPPGDVSNVIPRDGCGKSSTERTLADSVETMPPMPIPADAQIPPVTVSFDLMKVKVRDIKQMALFRPALSMLYTNKNYEVHEGAEARESQTKKASNRAIGEENGKLEDREGGNKHNGDWKRKRGNRTTKRGGQTDGNDDDSVVRVAHAAA